MKRGNYSASRLPLAAALVILSCLPEMTANAQVTDAYRRLWSDPAVIQRIERNIEMSRKGDATITIVGQEGCGRSAEIVIHA